MDGYDFQKCTHPVGSSEKARPGQFRDYQNALFRKLVLPWLILLFAVIIILAGMNFYQIGHIGDLSLANTANESARSLANYFLSTLNQAESIVTVIRMSNQTKELHDTEKVDNPAALAVASYEYMQFLDSLKLGYPAADSIWVIENDYIYSSDRTRWNVDMEQLDSLLSPSINGWIPFFSPGIVCSGAVGAAKTLTYLGFIPNMSGGQNTRVLINVGISRLVTNLLEYSGLDAFIIQDRNKDTILFSGNISSDMLGENEDDTVAAFKKAGYIWTCVSEGGYTFNSLVRLEANASRIKLQLIYSVVLVLLLLVIVVFTFFIITRRMYSPMENLFGYSQTNTPIMGTETTQAAKESLELMKTDYLPIQAPDENKIQKNALRTMDDLTIPQRLKKLNLTTPYVVITAGIDEPARQNGNAEKLMPYFEKLIQLFVQRITNPGEEVHTFFIHDYLVAALITLNSAKRFSFLDSMMSSLQEMLYAVSSCTVSFGCSRLHKNQKEAATAMTEAMRAIGAKMMFKPGCHIFYSESMDTPKCFVFPKARFQRLVQSFEHEEAENLRQQYRELISSIIEAGASADDLMIIYYQILGQIIQTQLQKGIPTTTIFNEAGISAYQYMATMEFSDHISYWLEEKIMLLQEQITDIYPA